MLANGYTYRDMAIREPSKPHRRKPRKRSARKPPTSPLLDWIIELGKQITPEDQALHPPDGARNLDHYLYDAPRS